MKMQKAFTLIELLVVIAIIAILAAILFPVFAQAKLAAKKTQGLAQMKQIGTSAQLYASDFDDSLPTWDYFFVEPYSCQRQPRPAMPASWQRLWDALLLPYVKSGNPTNQQWAGVWQSPGAEYAPTVGRSLGINQLLIWDIATGCLNSQVVASTNTATGTYVWPNASIIEEVSSTVFIADGGIEGRYEPVYFLNGYNDKFVLRRNPQRSAPWRYGNDGANYVMTDTSAKYLKGDAVYPNPGKTNASLANYNNALRGALRCSAAKNFAPTTAQKDLLRNQALNLYGVTCAN
jgi:prepilin-type N-terminal cleavage/methylation domain-containing protein